MTKHCVYKIKEESKKLFNEAFLSEYVYVFDFAINPLEEYFPYAIYEHVFIENFEPTSKISPSHMLPCVEFEKHFELHWDIQEAREKIMEARSKENTF